MAFPPASNKKINRSAGRVKTWWFSDEPTGLIDTDSELREAALLVYAFRLSFQVPLDKVAIQLRRDVARHTESSEVTVAQRLKRLPTILGKLLRHPTMDLTRMQDIGGCRAVLPTSREVQAVASRIRQRWDVRDQDDYIAKPKESGYRALHLVVYRDNRLIEIQLRTPAQHEWALTVERIGGRVGADLKSSIGPPVLLRFFQLASEGMSLEEQGERPSDSFRAEFLQAAEEARRYLPRKE